MLTGIEVSEKLLKPFFHVLEPFVSLHLEYKQPFQTHGFG